MANPQIKWQRFDTAGYNWLGKDPSDALPQIHAEFSAWLAVVNAHTSNAGRQISTVKDYTNGSGNYAGWTFKLSENNNTEHAYIVLCSVSGTAKTCQIGSGWTDNGGNGGYGAMLTASQWVSDASISWDASGAGADFILMSDTTEGEEFFIMGVNINGSTSYEGWVIWKADDGTWVFDTNDSTSGYTAAYFDDAIGTGWGPMDRSASRGTDTNVRFTASTSASYFVPYYTYDSLSITTPDTNPLNTDAWRIGRKLAANERLCTGENDFVGGRTYVYTGFDPDNKVYRIMSWPYGPSVWMDVRNP